MRPKPKKRPPPKKSPPKAPSPNRNLLRWEKRLLTQGFQFIAGVDEVGRGCLAGPVFAAAVIFPQGVRIPEVDDSKKLLPPVRERLFEEIIGRALAWAVASVSSEEIDQINIHHASLKAMSLALGQLTTRPDYILVDGKFPVPIDFPQKPLIEGDSRSHSIAAASIIAKVTRDRWISEQERQYPGFSFGKHKGYGTALHREEIQKYGLTPLHRRSFSLHRD